MGKFRSFTEFFFSYFLPHNECLHILRIYVFLSNNTNQICLAVFEAELYGSLIKKSKWLGDKGNQYNYLHCTSVSLVRVTASLSYRFRT